METASPGNRSLDGCETKPPMLTGRPLVAAVPPPALVSSEHGQVNPERFGIRLEDALVGYPNW